MRELTPEEIKNAPEWATHYQAIADTISFESENKTQLMINGEFGNLIPFGPVSEHSKPIPRKEFDIGKYKFDAKPLKFEFGSFVAEYQQWGGNISGWTTEELDLEISKQDAIALALHFKLTASDLS